MLLHRTRPGQRLGQGGLAVDYCSSAVTATTASATAGAAANTGGDAAVAYHIRIRKYEKRTPSNTL